jgi:outer membrane protein assembly factor BamB
MKRGVAVLALAQLAGCSGSAIQPADLPELVKPREVRVLWRASVGDADLFTFTPILAAGSVYATGRDGTVVRLDAASGKELWRASAEMELSGGVGADASLVVVASEKGEVAALDAASGKPRWRARVSSEVLSAPTVGEGLVIVRSIDNRLFAFGAGDGKRRWVYQRPPSVLSLRAPSAAVIDGDTVYAGFRGGKLVALALSNGGVRWEATVALPKGTTELERVVDVVGEPVVQGREVCAAAYQGRVACYERSNGNQIWARDISTATGVSLDARYAYVSDDRGAVHAFDRSSGRSVWKQDRLTLRQLSLPQPAGEVLAVGDFEGQVHFLSRDSGAFVARHASDGGDRRFSTGSRAAGTPSCTTFPG